LLVSISHASSIQKSLSVQPDPVVIATSEPAPSRAEVAYYQRSNVYAGSGCINCQKTTLTYTAR
jgi:hypothetical protein